MTKVVLAYSGGLDTSVILAWLREVYDADVITFTADVGQGEEVAEARQKALDTGAVEAVVSDLRREFVTEAVFPAFRAGALYEGYYLLGTSLARPIITQGMIEVARRFGADAISHGATGKGNDQVRFELSAYALEPDIEVIAPWREWDLKGRADLVEYARKRGIPVPVSPEKPYSTDANLLHVSYEGGILEDPWASPPEDMFTITTDPRLGPEEPEEIVLSIEKGNPVAVNGERLEPVAMLEELNRLGGRHGVGRVDMVENRFVGIKSRGVYETPGGTILFHALRAVESITLDRQVAHLRDELAPRYSEMVYNGFWFAPERYALQTLFDEMAESVTGEARLSLFKGTVTVLGRRAPFSLYDPDRATFEEDKVYDQADAGGFIRINSLRVRPPTGSGEG
ncbi:MAG: argininosuccinate synthase [bacterium]|nr:argininosuccinate synthase [bacterium]MDE0501128.1 argininosuccinate synthase [bacterium]